MKIASSVLVATLFLACVAALAPQLRADSPVPSTGQTEIRANQAFNRGEYNTALPLLKKLSDAYKDEPARLGPIQEKIRVCEKALASLKTYDKATAVAAPSAVADVTAEARKPHRALKVGEVAEMTIKELGNFDYDQDHGGNIPADVRALSGSKVRIGGFMLPLDQAANITQFQLVPSLFICCFGQPAGIQHRILVNCPKGKSVDYFPDEILVEGTLKVSEKKDDGYIVSIFEIDVSSVKPAPK